MKAEDPESESEPNIEYVSEQLDVKGSALEAFSDVFARFQLPPETSTVSLIPFVSLSWQFLSSYLNVGSQDRELKRRDNILGRRHGVRR